MVQVIKFVNVYGLHGLNNEIVEKTLDVTPVTHKLTHTLHYHVKGEQYSAKAEFAITITIGKRKERSTSTHHNHIQFHLTKWIFRYNSHTLNLFSRRVGVETNTVDYSSQNVKLKS